MRTQQCSSNSLYCFAMRLTAALLSLGRRLRPDVCPCAVSSIFSPQKVLMITFVPVQPPHAVHPAAPPLCSHQHPAAGAATGHGHADHAALAPSHRHSETTAPHHGPGKLPAPKTLQLLLEISSVYSSQAKIKCWRIVSVSWKLMFCMVTAR